MKPSRNPPIFDAHCDTILKVADSAMSHFFLIGQAMNRMTLLVAALALVLAGCHKKQEEKKAVAPRRSKPTKKIPPPPPPPVKTGQEQGTGPAVAKAFHPDYPTPKLAESEAIFLLEEPDRGPVVRTMEVKSTEGLKWSLHAHCELSADQVVCGPSLAKAAIQSPRLFWRVGRRKGRQVLVERRFGPRVESTLIIESGQGGKTRRMVQLSSRGVVRWSRHFDSKGTRYSSRQRSGENNLKGCGYMAMTRDKAGMVSGLTCTQWTVGVMKDTQGVVRTLSKRDRNGQEVERIRLNERGEHMVGHDGYHQRVTTRDKSGRPGEVRYKDLKGFPVMDAGSGCHGWRYAYNARGLKERKICLAAGEMPAGDNQGVCGYRWEYDGRGCKVRQVNLMLQGSRCRKPSKQFVYTVDEHCDRLTKVCLTPKGKRTTCGTSQPAEFRHRRNAQGVITSTTHFAKDHKPGRDVSCSAFEVRFTYDDHGTEVGRAWFGPGNKPRDCWGTGFHAHKSEVDEVGRIIRRRFFDEKGKPTTNLGCAVRGYTYDNYDHTVETEDRGPGGELSDQLGMARKRYIYDAGHRNFGMLLFDARGEPSSYSGCFTGQRCTKKKWHALRITRGANGAVDKNLFFDRAGQLIDSIDCAKELCWQ